MCDYSLEHLMARNAVASETLVSTSFPETFTRGFASALDLETAVCLSPGTEVAFDTEPRYIELLDRRIRVATSRLARFRQIDLDMIYAHHDALEFLDGSIIRVCRLIEGQRATVLQLPKSMEKTATMVATTTEHKSATPSAGVLI